MRTLKLKLLAATIEYHWWCIDYLQKAPRHGMTEKALFRQDFHRFKAEQLSVLYEIYMGLRDWQGKIIA